MKTTDKKRKWWTQSAKLWSEAKKKFGAASYEIAALVAEFLAAAGDPVEFMVFMTNGLGEERATALAYRGMADGLASFPDKADWARFGWDGLKILMLIQDDKKLRDAVKSLRVASGRGEVVGPKKIKDVVSKFLPKPPAAGKPLAEFVGRRHPATQLSAVASWFHDHAIIEGGWLRLRVAMSNVPPEVREALALDEISEPVEA